VLLKNIAFNVFGLGGLDLQMPLCVYMDLLLQTDTQTSSCEPGSYAAAAA